MTNELLAGKETGNDEAPVENNLIHLEGEVKSANRAKDINARINLLEGSLSELQSELDTINRSVDEGLERLGDNELDLTSKVSETYKRLGEIDNTYKTLSEISSNIDSEVKKLTSEITTLAELSAADLEKLQSSTSVQNKQLNQQHEQLVVRVNELVRHSAETGAQLSQSIQHNTNALLKLEKELVAEIDTLANVTQDRDRALAIKLERSQKDIENSNARILKMQKIDEVLAGRASALEASTAELISKTREIDSSIELLDLRTKDLSRSVVKLQEESARHASMIVSIQDNAGEMLRSLNVLIGTEGRHFRFLSGAFILALLAIVLLYFYQTSLHTDEALLTAERSQAVDQKITDLQLENTASEVALTEVRDELVTMNAQLTDEVKVLNNKLVTMNDQVKSIDGRIDHALPFSRFGKDSVIHGSQWLMQQPAQNMVIQIAMVSSEEQMYKIAQQYSYYLSDELSFYTVNSASGTMYVLVYGSFAGTDQASSVVWRLPRHINYQSPKIINVGDIQRFI